MNRLGICWGVVVLVAFAAIGWLGPRVAAKRDAAPAIEAPPIDAVKHDYVQLMQKQVNYEGTDDPKTKLSECLDELGSIYTCTFDVNEAAFKLEGLSDVLNTPLTADGRPLPKMTNVRFDRVLKKLLSRIPGEATFVVHDDVIEITTRQALLAQVYGNNPHRDLPLVYADFEKKPLEDALKELGKQSEFNILIDPRPAEKIKTGVTAKLKNVPLDSAVQLLADMADLKAVLQDNVLYVTTKENAKGIESDIRKKNEGESQRPLDGGKGGM